MGIHAASPSSQHRSPASRTRLTPSGTPSNGPRNQSSIQGIISRQSNDLYDIQGHDIQRQRQQQKQQQQQQQQQHHGHHQQYNTRYDDDESFSSPQRRAAALISSSANTTTTTTTVLEHRPSPVSFSSSYGRSSVKTDAMESYSNNNNNNRVEEDCEDSSRMGHSLRFSLSSIRDNDVEEIGRGSEPCDPLSVTDPSDAGQVDEQRPCEGRESSDPSKWDADNVVAPGGSENAPIKGKDKSNEADIQTTSAEDRDVVAAINRDMLHRHMRVKWIRVYVSSEVSYDLDDDTFSRLGFDGISTIKQLGEVIRTYLTRKCFAFLNPIMMTLDPPGSDNMVEVSSIRKIMYVYVKESRSHEGDESSRKDGNH